MFSVYSKHLKCNAKIQDLKLVLRYGLGFSLGLRLGSGIWRYSRFSVGATLEFELRLTPLLYDGNSQACTAYGLSIFFGTGS